MTTDDATNQAELLLRGIASAVRHQGTLTLAALDPNAVFSKSR